MIALKRITYLNKEHGPCQGTGFKHQICWAQDGIVTFDRKMTSFRQSENIIAL